MKLKLSSSDIKKIGEFAKKAEILYDFMHWEWGMDNWAHTPTSKEIEKTIYELIDYLKPESSEVSTGGLFIEQHDKNLLTIGFRVESSITLEI